MFKYVFKTITIFKTKSNSDLQDNKLVLEVHSRRFSPDLSYILSLEKANILKIAFKYLYNRVISFLFIGNTYVIRPSRLDGL
jgi:hypothetical protein